MMVATINVASPNSARAKAKNEANAGVYERSII